MIADLRNENGRVFAPTRPIPECARKGRRQALGGCHRLAIHSKASIINHKSAVEETGFTLIEIMAALVILGTAVLVLLDTHYNALQLFDETREAIVMDSLMEWALGLAEVEVQAGNPEGSGDFGERYEGYAYSYSAVLPEDIEGVALYTVTVTVTAPDDERTLTMLVYNMGVSLDGAPMI